MEDLVQHQAMTFEAEIIPTAPFDATAAFRYLARCTGELVDVVQGTGLTRALQVGGTPVLARITSVGAVQSPRLVLRLTSPALTEATGAGALVQIRRFLNADVDPAPFLERCAEHPLLAPLAARRPGVRPVGTPTVFEAIAWAITGQHVALPVACMLKTRLVRLFGGRYGDAWLFPSPEALARADPDLLGRSGFPRAKTRALTTLALRVASGEFDPESLWGLPREEASKMLQTFPGIGPWTAEYALGRGLQDADAYPVGDAGLRQALVRLSGDPSVTDEAVRRFGEQFAGWRAHLAFLLWSAL